MHSAATTLHTLCTDHSDSPERILENEKLIPGLLNLFRNGSENRDHTIGLMIFKTLGLEAETVKWFVMAHVDLSAVACALGYVLKGSRRRNSLTTKIQAYVLSEEGALRPLLRLLSHPSSSSARANAAFVLGRFASEKVLIQLAEGPEMIQSLIFACLQATVPDELALLRESVKNFSEVDDWKPLLKELRVTHFLVSHSCESTDPEEKAFGENLATALDLSIEAKIDSSRLKFLQLLLVIAMGDVELRRGSDPDAVLGADLLTLILSDGVRMCIPSQDPAPTHQVPSEYGGMVALFLPPFEGEENPHAEGPS